MYMVLVEMLANRFDPKNLAHVRIFNCVGVMCIFRKILYKASTKPRLHFCKGWPIILIHWRSIIARELQSP